MSGKYGREYIYKEEDDTRTKWVEDGKTRSDAANDAALATRGMAKRRNGSVAGAAAHGKARGRAERRGTGCGAAARPTPPRAVRAGSSAPYA